MGQNESQARLAAGSLNILVMIRHLGFLLCLLVPVAPGAASAWSGDGHRIICGIAWDEFTPPTREAVKAALGVQFREQFADTCVWADDERTARPETSPWHYVWVPFTATAVDVARDCPEPRSCVIVQIDRQAQKLRGAPSPADKAAAIKFLAHLIGDVHQPLRVGHGEDRGGNELKGRFHGEDTDLFTVWDAGLIVHQGNFWPQVVVTLQNAISRDQREEWMKGTPLDWANESLAIAMNPDTKYGPRFDGFQLGPEYQAKMFPVAAGRLSQAGVRLGKMLNETLK